MKIKVCGMKDPENIEKLRELPIDFMGFIFYSRSPRYAMPLNEDAVNAIPANIGRTGVFVNEIPSRMFSYIETYGLKYVQLHGTEDLHYCSFIKKKYPDVKLIKAFQIASTADFQALPEFEKICDYFLFDTKSPSYGGSGEKFDWKILFSYNLNTPFFLSGGISPDDVVNIKRIPHPQLFAIDLNSKFETEPGIKDIEVLSKFITEIKSQ